ncbi:hypothetical protein U1Q18_031176 [Sarracenia purpurea var. burkii]
MLIAPKKRKMIWAKISSEEASEALGDPFSERVGQSGRTRGLSLRLLNIKDQGKSPSAGLGCDDNGLTGVAMDAILAKRLGDEPVEAETGIGFKEKNFLGSSKDRSSACSHPSTISTSLAPLGSSYPIEGSGSEPLGLRRSLLWGFRRRRGE